MDYQAYQLAGKTKRKAKNNRRKILLASFGLLAIISLRYATIAGLIMLTFLLAFAVNYLEMWILGLELATLTTVLAGASFGPATGAAIGILSIVGHLIFGRYMSIYVFWLVPSYAAAGFMAGTMAMPITQLGITILIGLHAAFLIFLLAFSIEELSQYVFYGALNIAVNVGLFVTVAPVLFQLMG